MYQEKAQAAFDNLPDELRKLLDLNTFKVGFLAGYDQALDNRLAGLNKIQTK